MSCDIEQELTAFVDGELDAGTHQRVTEHLPACASCTATVATLKRAVAATMAVRDSLAPEPSARLRREVLSAIDAPTRTGWLSSFFRPAVVVPAGALAAGLAVAVVLSQRDDGAVRDADVRDPAQLEIARNLEELEDLEVLGLENAEDLEVVLNLHELEATP